MKRIFWAMAALAWPLAARAEPPHFVPARDVAITYSSAGSEAALPARVVLRYFAAGDKIRLDGSQGPYLVLDRVMERIEVVIPDAKLAMELPPGGGLVQGFVLGDGLNFHRSGAGNVLGHACAVYDVTLEGRHASACISADGLLLRGESTDPSGRKARIEAVSISFAPQPAGMFAPPDSYRYVALPR